jgi:hypothetical protein
MKIKMKPVFIDDVLAEMVVHADGFLETTAYVSSSPGGLLWNVNVQHIASGRTAVMSFQYTKSNDVIETVLHDMFGGAKQAIEEMSK